MLSSEANHFSRRLDGRNGRALSVALPARAMAFSAASTVASMAAVAGPGLKGSIGGSSKLDHMLKEAKAKRCAKPAMAPPPMPSEEPK